MLMIAVTQFIIVIGQFTISRLLRTIISQGYQSR